MKSSIEAFSLRVMLIIGPILSEVKGLENGHIAQPTEFPHITKVCYRHIPQCSGIIFDETRIIVMASCFGDDSAAALEVVLWSVAVDSTTFDHCDGLKVDSIRYHPQRFGDINDIAVVKLSERISSSSTVQPIRIGSFPTAPCATCKMTGWMKVDNSDDEVLAWSPVHIFNRERCFEFGLDIGEAEACFTDPTARAVISDIDYGSSIVCDGKLVGMVIDENDDDPPATPHRMIVLSYYVH